MRWTEERISQVRILGATMDRAQILAKIGGTLAGLNRVVAIHKIDIVRKKYVYKKGSLESRQRKIDERKGREEKLSNERIKQSIAALKKEASKDNLDDLLMIHKGTLITKAWV